MRISLRSFLVVIALLAVTACGGDDDGGGDDGGGDPGETGADASTASDQVADDVAGEDRVGTVDLPTDPIPYDSVFISTDTSGSECLLIDPATVSDAVGAAATVVSASATACRMQTMPGSTLDIVVGDDATGLLAGAYTLDAETIEQPQDGPGSNAVLYLDPPIDGLRDSELPFGYSFDVDSQPVGLRMSGLGFDPAGWRTIADAVAVNLADGVDTEPESAASGPSCAFVSEADIGALTGLDESEVVLEAPDPRLSPRCKWSLGGQKSLQVAFADNNQFTFAEQLAEPDWRDRSGDFDGELVASPESPEGSYYVVGYFEEDSYTGISVSASPNTQMPAADALLANILSRVERPNG